MSATYFLSSDRSAGAFFSYLV